MDTSNEKKNRGIKKVNKSWKINYKKNQKTEKLKIRKT